MSKRPIAPPKLAERFFKWYCRNELADSILGDMYERFYDNFEKSGKLRANLNFWLNTIRFMNRYTLTKRRKNLIKQRGVTIMFRHHLTSSYRNLKKHKIYTFINVSGLVISLASCLLIANFLNNELSYDNFHKNSKNIYRINHLLTDNAGGITRMANTPPALVPGIRSVFPEIKQASQMRYTMRLLLENGSRRFYESQGFYTDSSFFKIFSFPLVAGNKNSALDLPNSVVITQKMAAKYFGSEDPMGKVLTMNNDINLKVTGILEPVPVNSHLQFDFLVSFSTYKVPDNYLSDLTSWSWAGFLSYVLLDEGADPGVLQDKIDQLYRDLTSGNNIPNRSYVQSLNDIYLDSSDLVDDLASGLQAGNRFTIYSLATVAILILLIATFNFMNLTVAVSTARLKEVGLRKMLGADRRSLAAQLLTESVLLGLISLFLAYLLNLLTFHYIKDTMEWNFSIEWNQVLFSLPFALVITLFIGIGAGFYPALSLSGHRTVAALKNSIKNSFSAGAALRKFLIAFQFCISISLIAATIVITMQYQYLSDQKLGFDKENVVVIKLLREDMTTHYETIKERLLQNNHIKSVSQSQRSMGEPWPVNMILVEGKDDSEIKRIVGNQVGYDYLATMDIKLIEGRSFSKEFTSDSTKSIIISRKTAEYLGFDDPIGQQVNYFSFEGPRTVIGLVEDFNFLSLHHEIYPMALILPFVDVGYLYVRFTPGNLNEKITALMDIWEETTHGVPLEFSLLDEQLGRLYNNEEKLSSLIFGFSGLTILLSSMGLYGLIAFSLNRRRKEMGIRKVLGASVSSLLIRFSMQYILLIGAASLIAIPAIQYVLSGWLEGFAYRVEIGWWIYLISMFALIVIALLTISHQALSAALVNPVNVLKDE
ncbi:ABC transporter permease [Bacteroidota bacterium]